MSGFIRYAEHLPDIPEDARRCEVELPDGSECRMLDDEHWSDEEDMDAFVNRVLAARLTQVWGPGEKEKP